MSYKLPSAAATSKAWATSLRAQARRERAGRSHLIERSKDVERVKFAQARAIEGATSWVSVNRVALKEGQWYLVRRADEDLPVLALWDDNRGWRGYLEPTTRQVDLLIAKSRRVKLCSKARKP